MPNDYVNTITLEDTTEYDIQDKRIQTGNVSTDVQNIIKDVVRPLLGTEIKYGYYKYNKDDKFEYIGSYVPEDIEGSIIGFLDDGLYISSYENGSADSEVFIGYSGSINLTDNDGSASINSNGVDKLNFPALTHSSNELGTTLKAILDEASTGETVSCTLAQWNVIKALFDKSLYFYINGYTLIKCMTQADDSYIRYLFWGRGGNYGASIEFEYSVKNETLVGEFSEV